MNAEIFLPWPSKALSPNSSGHWSKQSKAKKAYRTYAGWCVREQHIGKINADALHVKLTFFPPDNRARDLDNMIASLKSGLDGISDVIGVDDSRWTLSASKAAPIAKEGMVKIELEWNERQASA